MRYGLAIGLILLAVAGRLIPHPDNFTPIMAVALFAVVMCASLILIKVRRTTTW